LVHHQLKGYPYSLAGNTATAADLAHLQAVDSAIPQTISECEARIEKMKNDIQEKAAAAGIDLRKLISHLRTKSGCATDQRLKVHFENGRLDF